MDVLTYIDKIIIIQIINNISGVLGNEEQKLCT